jgi:DNA replication initiation complex subunit (GINS family)
LQAVSGENKMITYNDIYEAARKERYSEQLQPIPKNFVVEVAKYLKDKKEIASKNNDDFSDVIIKTKKQLENAITLFKEFIIRRRKKILNLVLVATETGISKQDFENMFAIEKELFEELMNCMDISDKKLTGILNENVVQAEKSNELILFIDNVDEFLGLEGEKMGPYSKGEIANIPKEIAKILSDSGKAEVIVEK